MAEPSGYPVRVDSEYIERPSRMLALLGIFYAPKLLLLVPHSIALYFLSLIRFIIVWFAYWVVLITGRYPRGIFDFVVGATRWETRVNLWFFGIVDRYPPFSLD